MGRSEPVASDGRYGVRVAGLLARTSDEWSLAATRSVHLAVDLRLTWAGGDQNPTASSSSWRADDPGPVEAKAQTDAPAAVRAWAGVTSLADSPGRDGAGGYSFGVIAPSAD